jgi:phosphoribosylaminoimidazole-succinocarboxamide synthase
MMSSTLLETNFNFKLQTNYYKGKVREVYTLSNHQLIMIATDRLSAFDVVLPKGIPFKGQILNQIASDMLKATEHQVPNWLTNSPDPNVAIGHQCEPFKVEMVVRAYLAGHAWREYKSGKREICGVNLPDGLNENDKLPQPIITPTTKADLGSHDQDISRQEILNQHIVSQQDYEILEDYSLKLFQLGTEIAQKRGLILVDTKYEFGKTVEGDIVVIDEIHTPDSSRYFYADTYQELQKKGLRQKQLSKEFVREWLIENGFQGEDHQKIPEMTTDFITSVSNRYIELYEKITGKNFVKADISAINHRIENNLKDYF